MTEFSNNIGSESSLLAELWGFVIGLRRVRNSNIRKIWAEGDSRLVINLLNYGCPTNHSCASLTAYG